MDSDFSNSEVMAIPERYSLKDCFEAMLDGFKPRNLKSSKLVHCLEALKHNRPVSDVQVIDYVLSSTEDDNVSHLDFDDDMAQTYIEWAIQTVENGEHRNHFDYLYG